MTHQSMPVILYGKVITSTTSTVAKIIYQRNNRKWRQDRLVQ